MAKCPQGMEAEKRQAKYYGNQYESGLTEKFPEVQKTEKTKGEARNILGAMADVSGRTYDAA